MKKYLFLFLVFSVLGFGISCGPYKPDVNQAPMQETEKIVFLDYVLSTHLNVVKHASSSLDGGQLQVKMEIENEENDDIWTDVKVVFRGPDGFEVEATQWEPFQFHRRSVTTFQRNSLSAKAADYRVLIRKIKNK